MNYLFHGTSANAARTAIEKGLTPRGDTAGNFTENAGMFLSRSDWVYLTQDAPLYYAAKAVNDPTTTDKLGAVIRVDFDRLDKGLLRPDEDYFYLQNPLKSTDDPRHRMQFVESCKLKAEQNPGMWQESLHAYGSIAYAGIIPPPTFLDVRFVDFIFYSVLHGALGSLGEKVMDRSSVLSVHSELMKWLYGGQLKKLPSPLIDKLVDLAAQNLEFPTQLYRSMKADKIRNLRQRSGLSIRSLREF